tara:strand:+ start:548 stop:1003 length:456 start_codon:yes stop_codon:yes gene_type:complete
MEEKNSDKLYNLIYKLTDKYNTIDKTKLNNIVLKYKPILDLSNEEYIELQQDIYKLFELCVFRFNIQNLYELITNINNLYNYDIIPYENKIKLIIKFTIREDSMYNLLYYQELQEQNELNNYLYRLVANKFPFNFNQDDIKTYIFNKKINI